MYTTPAKADRSGAGRRQGRGGPFSNFTGVWHPQGTFVSANGSLGSVVDSTSSLASPSSAGATALAFTGMSA